jgi:hypothetical protein
MSELGYSRLTNASYIPAWATRYYPLATKQLDREATTLSASAPNPTMDIPAIVRQLNAGYGPRVEYVDPWTNVDSFSAPIYGETRVWKVGTLVTLTVMRLNGTSTLTMKVEPYVPKPGPVYTRTVPGTITSNEPEGLLLVKYKNPWTKTILTAYVKRQTVKGGWKTNDKVTMIVNKDLPFTATNLVKIKK